MLKKCYKCKIEKSITEFHKNKAKKGGINSKCKICVLEYSKKYYKNNTEKKKQLVKNWESKNPERKKINRKNNYIQNKDREIKYSKNYFQEQYNNNPKFKLHHVIRNRIHASIKNKSESSLDILGCNIEYYYFYLESQFTGKMNWENYGKYWEIDHIIPINTFSLDEYKKAFNYKNTRPLSITENRKRPKCGKDLYI